MADLEALEKTIEDAFERRADLDSSSTAELDAVNEVLNLLETGDLRVAEPAEGDWKVNQWVKKGVLLSFKLQDNKLIDAGNTKYFDKVPLK